MADGGSSPAEYSPTRASGRRAQAPTGSARRRRTSPGWRGAATGCPRFSCSARRCVRACSRRRRPRWNRCWQGSTWPTRRRCGPARRRFARGSRPSPSLRTSAPSWPSTRPSWATAARFAVRTSVSGEDSAANSFAGQLDTALNVGQDGIEEAVLECLASAYSERALFYRQRRGLPGDEVAAAVIVQVLVDSAVSGVVFSCNPQSGDMAEAVVSAGLRPRRGRRLGNGRV